MKINELDKYYGQYFSEIFKSITFDKVVNSLDIQLSKRNAEQISSIQKYILGVLIILATESIMKTVMGRFRTLSTKVRTSILFRV